MILIKSRFEVSLLQVHLCQYHRQTFRPGEVAKFVNSEGLGEWFKSIDRGCFSEQLFH